jgi:cbb3-type cytochrome oxidase maturation protein
VATGAGAAAGAEVAVTVLLYLLPAALFLGLLGLGAFIWSLKSGQYDDLDGAAQRILFDDDEAPPPPPKRKRSPAGPDA